MTALKEGTPTPRTNAAPDVMERLRRCIKLFHNADENWGHELIHDYDSEAPEGMTLMEWIEGAVFKNDEHARALLSEE